MKLVPFLPYLIWYVGIKQLYWGWFPEFFVAMGLNIVLHLLLRINPEESGEAFDKWVNKK